MSSLYLADFRCSASVAACAAFLIREGARLSTQVKSHARHSPRDQGILVTPSGRLPSFLKIPVGSREAGMPADCIARNISSLHSA